MLNDKVATPLVVPPLRPEPELVTISVISPVAAAGGVYVNCLEMYHILSYHRRLLMPEQQDLRC